MLKSFTLKFRHSHPPVSSAPKKFLIQKCNIDVYRLSYLSLIFFYYSSYIFCIWFFCLLQFKSVTQSCLIFCDPMDCSMPGLPSITRFSNQWQNQNLNPGLADAEVMLSSPCSAQLRCRALLRGWDCKVPLIPSVWQCSGRGWARPWTADSI